MDSQKQLQNMIVIFGLVIVVPTGYIIAAYTLYWLFTSGENVSEWPARAKIGIAFALLLPPLGHWSGYHYCREYLGWFKKK
ncbi:MAG: hypothetical protein ACK4VO_13075 [Pseudobdellovibrio sp.]